MAGSIVSSDIERPSVWSRKPHSAPALSHNQRTMAPGKTAHFSAANSSLICCDARLTDDAPNSRSNAIRGGATPERRHLGPRLCAGLVFPPARLVVGQTCLPLQRRRGHGRSGTDIRASRPRARCLLRCDGGRGIHSRHGLAGKKVSAFADGSVSMRGLPMWFPAAFPSPVAHSKLTLRVRYQNRPHDRRPHRAEQAHATRAMRCLQPRTM